MRASGKITCIASLLVIAGAALRLAAVPPALPDLDAVNFGRALTRFDLAAQAPHFPGYPIYVLLARGFSVLGATDVFALALPGIVLGAAAVAALAAALLPYVGAAGALAGSAVVALAPLAVLQGGLPNSDGAGFAALVLALAAALAALRDEGRVLWAGFAAGLTLGIRPSYLPALVALPLLFAREVRLRWIAGAALGTLAWLLPLALLAGPTELAAVAGHFFAGHAGEWGGTAIVQPDLALRLSLFGFDFAAGGLGLPWPGASGAAQIAVALVLGAGLCALVVRGAQPGSVARAALLVGVPYAAWAFLGQNLLKARHVLPLLAAFALLLALVPAALQQARFAWTAALACALLAVALPLAREQGSVAAPGVQLVQHAAGHCAPEGTSWLTGEEARLFERYAPQYRAGRYTADDLPRAAAQLGSAGVHVYVSSAAPGFERLLPQLEEVARFAVSPLVRAHANPIVLYRYRPASAGGGELR